jgi:hypothetical protein
VRREVHRLVRDDLGLVPELPAEVEHERERNVHVLRREARDVELAVDRRPTVEEDDDREGDEHRPRKVRLEARVERQDVAGHALNLHALVEAQEGDGNTPPCDHGAER